MEEQILGVAGWVKIPKSDFKIQNLFQDIDENAKKMLEDVENVDVLHNPLLESSVMHRKFLQKIRSFLVGIQLGYLKFHYPLVGFAWKNLIIDENTKGVFYFRFYNNLEDNTKLLSETLNVLPANPSLVLKIMNDLVMNARVKKMPITYGPNLYQELRYHYIIDDDDNEHYDRVSLKNLWPYIGVETQSSTPCSEVLVSFCESFDDIYMPKHYDSNMLLIEYLIEHNESNFNTIVGFNDDVKLVKMNTTDEQDRLWTLLKYWLRDDHPHYNDVVNDITMNSTKKMWIKATKRTSVLLKNSGCRAFSTIARIKSDRGFYQFEEFSVYPVIRLLIMMMNFKDEFYKDGF